MAKLLLNYFNRSQVQLKLVFKGNTDNFFFKIQDEDKIYPLIQLRSPYKTYFFSFDVFMIALVVHVT